MITACAARPGGDVASRAEAPEAPEPQEDESDYDRQLRVARQRREQCNELIDAVQRAETVGRHIVNLNDGRRLESLARQIDDGAGGVAGLALSLDDLNALRGRYVDSARQISTALRDTATAGNIATKRSALQRYQKLDSDSYALIDEINGACNGEQASLR